jgi:hypothetical protein
MRLSYTEKANSVRQPVRDCDSSSIQLSETNRLIFLLAWAGAIEKLVHKGDLGTC